MSIDNMKNQSYTEASYDRNNPLSIYDYSRFLIGKSIHSLLGDEAIEHKRKGKGGLGQMVEELFFKYEVNSKREADSDRKRTIQASNSHRAGEAEYVSRQSYRRFIRHAACVPDGQCACYRHCRENRHRNASTASLFHRLA